MRSFLGWEKSEVAKRIEHALELAHALTPKQERTLRQVLGECHSAFEFMMGRAKWSAPSKKGKRARSPIPPSVRFAVLVRDRHRCCYCGAAAKDVPLVVDHVKPVSQGGSDDFDNLAASCVECNIGKSDRWSPE